MNEEHWTTLLNFQPRLNKLDIEVQIRNIEDPASDSQDAGQKSIMAKNKLLAAHVLCAEKDQEAVNLALCTTYGKERTASRAARNLPEGRAMKYIPFGGSGVIKYSPETFRRLQKTRLLHSWNQKNHHATSMWGFKDVYKILTAPNGHEFTICQVIMSIKYSYDYITPLFF